MIYGIFGPLLFARQVGVMNNFEERESTNFAEHPIHLQKSQLEFTGHGLTEVSFAMEFLVGLTMPPDAGIVLLNTLRKAARAYPLIIGARPIGSWASRFVITEIGAVHHWYMRGGAVQNATVRVSLKEYAPIAF